MFKEIFDPMAWLKAFFQMLDTITPTFYAEPIIGICYSSMSITISTLLFLAVCWVISWVPPIQNSRVLTFMVGLMGIVFSAHLNLITGRMTDIEFVWGSLGLMTAFALGLFLPREMIIKIINNVGKIGIGLPILVWILAEVCTLLQIADIFCWGFLITILLVVGYSFIPAKWKLRIQKRVNGCCKGVAVNAVTANTVASQPKLKI